MGAVWEEPVDGCSFTVDPDGYVVEGSGDEDLSIGAPLGIQKGCCYTRDVESHMLYL
jgi:hypothetical protein